jgi:hypothetical protein
MVVAKGRLFVELVKVGGGWLWRSDMVDSRMEVVLGYCLGDFFKERAKGKVGNMAGEVVPIALCG